MDIHEAGGESGVLQADGRPSRPEECEAFYGQK